MAQRAERRLRVVLVGLLIGLLAMTIVGCAFAWNAATSADGARTATDALRVNSARAECRTKIVNELEQQFRHDVAEVLEAAAASNDARVTQLVRVMVARADANELIAERCPKPLARP